ncbi:nuclear transport factor 2 family protein [Sphingomonas immobilis]|uniref:Nuclear transport factor 2 family protein n=1 Tax=Sphingomonas immobilis TaxID=3063997 RepID=A0ABT9A1T9_9SPHN|nr:nuclear transport factor 2 family protein [Sphingomonas sp. CA1-15]MDO7843781.1 nuclear transport factor 2 family protein [Sphingomonas sp. CA1-15]
MDQHRDPEVQRLIDESAIRHLLALYPRALDRQDSALLASLFHPDAVDDHGHYNGPASGFVEWMKSGSRPGVHWTHHNGTQIIEIEGDVAQTETYCIALCRHGARGEAGFEKETFLRVRYLDRVEKREGKWKIAHRRVIFSPCHIADASHDFDASMCLQEGGFPADEVYRW